MRKAVIRLDPDLEILLKLEARRQNRSLSDVVRRLLREGLRGGAPAARPAASPEPAEGAPPRPGSPQPER